MIAGDSERDLEIRLDWPTSHVGTLLPARQTRFSGRQARSPRKPAARSARPLRSARREREPSQALATTRGNRRFSEGPASPAILELARRVQELTAVVAGLGTRMTAQAAEMKQAGGAFNELRASTDELRHLRDSIESLVTTRNERQAGLERQLGLLTDEIRALRRQVPASKRGGRDADLAEAIGDAVRSAVGPNGNGSGNGNGHRPSKSRQR